MAPSINYDTPDYQRGIINAQALLTNISSGVGHVTIGVPPNAGTLIVVAADAPSPILFCQGLTTGLFYPCVESVGRGAGGFAGTQFFINAASVLDEQVTITWGSAPIQPWQVYADSGAHIVADVSKRIDQDGVQYVLPTIPSTTTRYHPLNELQYAGFGLSATGVFLGAPGAGLRTRLFTLGMSTDAATPFLGYLVDVVAGPVLFANSGGNSSVTYPAQGVALATNSAVQYELATGSGLMVCTATYTVEEV